MIMTDSCSENKLSTGKIAPPPIVFNYDHLTIAIVIFILYVQIMFPLIFFVWFYIDLFVWCIKKVCLMS